IRCYQKTLEQNPNHVHAYFALAMAYGQLGETKRAIALYQRVIQLQPNLANAYNNLGCLLFAKNDYDGALEVWNKSLTYNQTETENALTYNNIGQVLAAQGKIKEAIQSYRQALETKEDFTLAYTNLAKILQQQNQHQNAVYYLQKVIKLEPDNLFLHTDCGASLLNLGRLDAALSCFKKVIDLEPKFVEGYCQGMQQLSGSDELSLARKSCADFLTALQKEDNLGDTRVYEHLYQTYLHLGNTLTIYGKFDQAVGYYQKAAQIQPYSVENYLKLGNCLFKNQQFNAALTVYQTALNLLQQSSNFYPTQLLEVNLQLGRILEQQGDWESATDYYSQVLQMQENSRFQSWMSHSPSTLTLLQEWANAPHIQRMEIPQGVCDSTLTWLKNNNLQDSNYCNLSELLGSGSQDLDPCTAKPNKCGGLDCEICLKGVFKSFRWQNLGQGIQKALTSKNNTTSTPLFVAVIPNGRAWIVPQQNYWLVCKAIAIMTPDNQLLADVSREYPAPLPGCPSYDPQQHQVFQQSQLPPLQQIEGRVAVLSGLSGNVYFHWMVDILPRLELLRQSGIKLEQIDWFLVNSYQAPFQRETLTRLGIPEFKILESDRFPHIQAQQLIVPSFAGYMGWLQPWAIDTLRRWFLPKSRNPGRNYPERIYISRGNASYRRVLNEDEVIDFLRPWGFVTVQLETLSFGEQVALFAQAKVIMGAHGSGLTNILFCQPGTQVIEWMSPHYNRHYYWVISQYLGLEHYCLTGEGFSCYPLRGLMYQNPLTEDIWLNLISLKRLLEILFVGKSGK
ncbi:MAG TPA: tetratricopeptide repeat protein, partial [Candidatus Obscuribacterales bacterium]